MIGWDVDQALFKEQDVKPWFDSLSPEQQQQFYLWMTEKEVETYWALKDICDERRRKHLNDCFGDAGR